VIGNKAFQVSDAHRFIQRRSSAFGFALMVAHPAADAWEGIGLQENLVGVIQTVRPDQGHVTRNVHAYWAGMDAWSLEQGGTDHRGAALLSDMGFVFFSEIANGGKHRVGS